MASFQKVIVLGNLGKDPEVRFTTSGQPVCNFSIATNESWTDKQGQKQEHTEWHRIVVWGKQAENCGKYLAKGRQALVEGRLQTREYEKDGEKRYSTEIVATSVQFIGGGKGERQEQAGGSFGQSDFGPPPPSGSDDEIPF